MADPLREQQSLFGATVVLIEDKASGTADRVLQQFIDFRIGGANLRHPRKPTQSQN